MEREIRRREESCEMMRRGCFMRGKKLNENKNEEQRKTQGKK